MQRLNSPIISIRTLESFTEADILSLQACVGQDVLSLSLFLFSEFPISTELLVSGVLVGLVLESGSLNTNSMHWLLSQGPLLLVTGGKACVVNTL